MSEPQAPGSNKQEQTTVKLAKNPPPATLELRAAKLSDVGQARPHNEDYVDFLIPSDSRQLAQQGSIFLVADGMGGHQAGEVASRGAVEAVISHYQSDTSNDVGTSLVHAFRAANQKIFGQAEADPAKGGMGTTMVAAVVLGHKVYVANVGDSRAYLINSKGITQITEDHSWVEEQVRAGLLTEEQARRHPQRNLVTRALGSKAAVDIDLFEGEINAGDSLLLCSDGLTGRVTDPEIAAIVREHPPQEAAGRLIALANERGGNDNITALVIKAEEGLPTVQTPVAAAAAAPPHPRRSRVAPMLAGVLGLVVLLGIVGGAWAFRDRLFPGLFGRATATSSPTATAATAAVTATRTPATATVAPSSTAALPATATLAPVGSPVPTGTTTLTSTPGPAGSTTPTSEATAEADAGSEDLDLRTPPRRAPVRGVITFGWTYAGQLSAQQEFEVRIWQGERNLPQRPLFRIRSPEASLAINLDANLREKGIYSWRVLVVTRQGGMVNQLYSELRTFNYLGPSAPTP